MELKEKRVRITLVNTFKYAGPVLEDNEQFLIILDEKTQNKFVFNKTQIFTIEVLS